MRKNKSEQQPIAAKKSDLCPLCGQYMDLICTGYKNTLFVDYQYHPKMCFGCFHVPKTERQIYDEEGNLVESVELPFGPKHLRRASELVNLGCVSTREEAVRC